MSCLLPVVMYQELRKLNFYIYFLNKDISHIILKPHA